MILIILYILFSETQAIKRKQQEKGKTLVGKAKKKVGKSLNYYCYRYFTYKQRLVGKTHVIQSLTKIVSSKTPMKRQKKVPNEILVPFICTPETWQERKRLPHDKKSSRFSVIRRILTQ